MEGPSNMLIPEYSGLEAMWGNMILTLGWILAVKDTKNQGEFCDYRLL